MKKNKSIKRILFTLILLIVVIALPILMLQSFSTENVLQTQSTQNNISNFPQGYKIVTPKVPNQIEIFGEKVPLNNFEVYERVEREFIVNTYWHSLTVLTLKRANRWFPIIEPILKKNNVPDDFKYLCVTESTLRNLTSPRNAVGFWQFVKSAGKQFGLEINKEVDERYNVEKSTQAACKYLLAAKNKFGTWTLAAASYNMGITGIKKQLVLQKTKNYYNLVLGEETSRYVPRIIAAKVMMSNSEKYGFDIKQDELYDPFEFTEVTLKGSAKSLADYAKKKGINYKILKLYNPWLRKSYLENKKNKKYKIKIPLEGSIKMIKE
ncbi:MAG: transglycosylase SLT domain-containing protein [Melioribacteraceae bacterium]